MAKQYVAFKDRPLWYRALSNGTFWGIVVLIAGGLFALSWLAVASFSNDVEAAADEGNTAKVVLYLGCLFIFLWLCFGRSR